MEQKQRRILEAKMTKMIFDNLIAAVVKREHKKIHQNSTIAINALIPTLSRPEIQRSMTDTREWEYIKYPKPIISLKNFARNKTHNNAIIKHHFIIFMS